ncbi:MAG TPA: alpha/beta fold hydrolase [Povalibacter sp.]|uniref:alpha/beta hydrolase family protein n=1 Tax=Povalibacter sp. TaxID=1962978 RepID=UPI002D054BC7|nr:acyl-CoA thioester hydrolase/BAAT C-terminal domain-containing protein [Povalibacter sp.]HMN43050.1 alpha/beta fold hydrolase [Povalibacter sp.]
MRIYLHGAMFAVLLFSIPAVQARSAATDERIAPVPGTAFEARQIKDKLGRNITYYVSRPKNPAPLLLMIQGSGCVPVMNIQPGGAYSTLFNLLPFGNEGRFTVLSVEKPFAGVAPGQDPGTAQSCSADFNADFTAESWLEALRASLDDARRLPWVDKSRTVVFGISEGAVMGALLAGHDDRITDVISIGGSGTTQLFDFISLSYQRCFDVSTCLTDVDNQARAIAADPTSATSFAWGHSYKRWASFFRVDPAEELLRSRARFYLAFGTHDEAVPALSQEIAVAKLMAAGRDLTVRRVPNAGHNLMQSGAPDFGNLDKEFRAALSWASQARR